MSTITVAPSGLTFSVETGESVMAAARRQGFYWPTSCDGVGECRGCMMLIVEHADHLQAPNALERESLWSASASLRGDQGRWRLACQARVVGDVVVRKLGVSRMP